MSNKFKEISKIYYQFGCKWDGLDFSEKSLIEMYNNESYGSSLNKTKNGYYIGKMWMGVTISMWKEDIKKGYLGKKELYDDPNLPNWWLDKVLKE